METRMDITPKDPIPNISVGSLHPDCDKESVIVCDRQKMKGYQGVSLDALAGIFTRLGREVEEIGIANTYSFAEQVASVIEEGKRQSHCLKKCDVPPLIFLFSWHK